MIFIQANVASSKNNKVWTGKYLVWSKRATLYRKVTEIQFIQNRAKFLAMLEGKEKPYIIGFHFLRGTKHQWDFVNMVQTLQDLMVMHKYLEDDNVSNMLPVPLEIEGKYYDYVTQDKAGVYIQVL